MVYSTGVPPTNATPNCVVIPSNLSNESDIFIYWTVSSSFMFVQMHEYMHVRM